MRRLELLAVQLKQDGLCTIKNLADLHNVSERTIARDLQLMRDQGLPIDADRGRGGGVRLDRHWGVGRLNLNYPEAVDLLISVAVAEQMNSPMFLANLASIRRQLIASFSSDKRYKVSGLKSRILIGATASTFVQKTIVSTNDRAVQALHQAFLDQRSLDIRYKKESGEESKRSMEPHYLLLNYPVWYVLAFDHLRNAPRAFRCDRLLSAEVSDERFRLLPKSKFQQSLKGNDVI
ncbi:WYL domain-containing protein [Sneathiella marina]|uniref:WYL domain-containing protein n=1 Tax=Sneathiella marina TaxID=2950108 RepID=A0ABY4W5E9_9PROT|nr:WYL domain-containing protein [Sneathiella marina]USG62415.1 WYL domain-containing protein [Sneathiella marina]